MLDPRDFLHVAMAVSKNWWARSHVLYRLAGVDFDDVHQEALIVLFAAASRFDEAKQAGTVDAWLGMKVKYGLADHYRLVFGRKGTARRAQQFPLSLDASLVEGEEGTFADRVADSDDQYEIVDILDMVDRLEHRNGPMVRQRITGATLDEIGALLGVNGSRISQRLKIARQELAEMRI